jgi:two-component system response regulator TctD
VDTWQSLLPDVVVLDLTLPGLDGLEVLSQARAKGLSAPVIITTARGTVGDRILGLNVGADDYLAKPFDLDELEARIRAVERRARQVAASAAGGSKGSTQLAGGLSFDDQSGTAHANGKLLDLSPRESAMVRALMLRPGQAMSKERLFDAVFENDSDVALDAVEVVAYRLRKKLRDAGCNTQLVTLRGLGYLLQDHAPAAG